MITYKLKIDDNGTKYWYNENYKLHNEHGPAIEMADGHKEWWINGNYTVKMVQLLCGQMVKKYGW